MKKTKQSYLLTCLPSVTPTGRLSGRSQPASVPRPRTKIQSRKFKNQTKKHDNDHCPLTFTLVPINQILTKPETCIFSETTYLLQIAPTPTLYWFLNKHNPFLKQLSSTVGRDDSSVL